MSTVDTAALYETLRTRALGFSDPRIQAGHTVAASLGERVYNIAAPDSVPFPYAIHRIVNRRTAEDGNADREPFDLEVMLFGRPRTQAAAMERVADLYDAAFLRYADSSSGLVFSTRRARDTLPQGSSEADREVVQIRSVFSFVAWPLLLATTA
jgi:hypothetical protein